MATIYQGRDNAITLELTQDGQTVPAGVVTKAVFAIPGRATDSGADLTLETGTDGEIILNQDAQSVTIKAGNLPLKRGSFSGFLTVYDNQSPGGLAWAQVYIQVQDWMP